MHWVPAHFHEWTFRKHRLKILGWDPAVPFVHPSSIPGGKVVLRALCNAWESGATRFEEVSGEELARYAASRFTAEVVPGAFGELGRTHPGRSDVRRARVDRETGKPVAKRPKRGSRTGVKTPARLDESDME